MLCNTTLDIKNKVCPCLKKDDEDLFLHRALKSVDKHCAGEQFSELIKRSQALKKRAFCVYWLYRWFFILFNFFLPWTVIRVGREAHAKIQAAKDDLSHLSLFIFS